MAAAGTLLSDLDGSGGGGDGDLVQKILSDMNIPSGGSGGGGRPVPPPMQAQGQGQGQAQAHQGGMNRDPGYAGSTQNMTMDSRIPTSHMIGNEHPTPADFAAAMVGAPSMGSPFTQAPVAAMEEPMPGFASGGKMNIYSRIVQEIKVPFVVALLFFVFSLPPVRVLVSHYMRSMIKPTGELNMIGLLFISLVVGAVFWLLQRVIAPLLSL